MAQNLETDGPMGFGGKTTLLGVKICAAIPARDRKATLERMKDWQARFGT